MKSHRLTIDGTRFLLNGEPFPFTGVSFFNAIYNPAFNESSDARRRWMRQFLDTGINVLRIWCQWDNARGFVDSTPETTLYHPDGSLKEDHVATLLDILKDADALGMVVELVLFSQESWYDDIRLNPDSADRAVAAVTEAVRPYRNVTIQIWNEFAERVLDHLATVRSVDPDRLVTNSPGWAGDVGHYKENAALDYLTPHTTRGGRHWELAPAEIAYLLKRFRKPVVDDEPARNGTASFGGPKEATSAYDHILQIYQVWQLGAHIVYHHDMFQLGQATAQGESTTVPPHGIPVPDFNPYHREVLDFIRLRDRYLPA